MCPSNLKASCQDIDPIIFSSMQLQGVVKLARVISFCSKRLIHLTVSHAICHDCRECGIEVELDDIPVDSLVPEPLQATASVSEFMSELPKYDADMSSLLEKADSAGECLRFVGEISDY